MADGQRRSPPVHMYGRHGLFQLLKPCRSNGYHTTYKSLNFGFSPRAIASFNFLSRNIRISAKEHIGGIKEPFAFYGH